MRNVRPWLASLILILMATLCWQSVWADDVPRISVEELRTMLDQNDLVIIDVRPKAQWDNSEFKLPGAVNENPFKAGTWGQFYHKDMTIVLY